MDTVATGATTHHVFPIGVVQVRRQVPVLHASALYAVSREHAGRDVAKQRLGCGRVWFDELVLCQHGGKSVLVQPLDCPTDLDATLDALSQAFFGRHRDANHAAPRPMAHGLS